MTVNGPMTRSDRVAALEEAKAQFQKSWDEWKAWLGLNEAPWRIAVRPRGQRAVISVAQICSAWNPARTSPAVAYVGTHIRFGRGRGNGTALLSITVLCTGCGFEWVEAGAMKAAIGSLDAGFSTPCDLWMEPVNISLAGVFIPLLIFRSPKMLNTEITAAKMVTTVR
jgi:hypothetical protein